MNNVAKKTISIGIPAYNEAGNIATLLLALLKQKTVIGDIIEIIVIADCPTDATVTKVQSVTSPLIKLTVLEKRQGKVNAQNLITQRALGDILVMLDADILPASDTMIEEIIKPIAENPAIGLVGAAVTGSAPKNITEKIISAGHDYRYDVFKKINHTDNVYMCHGCARAFSRECYKTITWPDGPAEDSFSYIHCMQRGFAFAYADRAVVIIKLPSRLRDHVKQSVRFADGKKRQRDHFSKTIAIDAFHIPFWLAVREFAIHVFKNPLIIGYAAVTAYAAAARLWTSQQNHSLIDPPLSTKVHAKTE